MAMTKTEVRRAFREAMAADYADVPAKDALNHTFSPEFCAKMDALIAEQKRGSWRLLSRQSRRALVVAAILAASLLLVACTPRLREAVSEFVVTVYETFVDFVVDTEELPLRTEIESVYGASSTLCGLELVSQRWINSYNLESIYQDKSGGRVILNQSTMEDSVITNDIENSTSISKNYNSTDVWFCYSDGLKTAHFIYDGYAFAVYYIGEIELEEFERVVLLLVPLLQ